MTILNGGSGAKAVTHMTGRQHMMLFIDGITPNEWAILRYQPTISRPTELVCKVVELRRIRAAFLAANRASA